MVSTIFSLGDPERSAYLYGSWFPLVSGFSLECLKAFKCIVYKFIPTDAQNTMSTKLMLVHRKLMIAGSTDHLYWESLCLSQPQILTIKYITSEEKHMLESIVSQSKSASRHEKYWIFLANNSSTKIRLVTSKNALIGLQEWILYLNYKISSVLPEHSQ